MNNLNIIFYRGLSVFAYIFCVCINANAENESGDRIIRDVHSKGSCAVIGMSSEQSQLIALQRARSLAIEHASGVDLDASTLVTNGSVSVDFIKTYSKGLIIKEELEWLPIGQYQENKSKPPIPVYRVKIKADIYIPERTIKPINLEAKLNHTIFRSGEKVYIDIKMNRNAYIGIFNISADDNVTMLWPNNYENHKQKPISMYKFPSVDSITDLVVQTIEGHEKDAEAFFIIAKDVSCESSFYDIFEPMKPITLSEFFNKYSGIVKYCDDTLLAYEVNASQ